MRRTIRAFGAFIIMATVSNPLLGAEILKFEASAKVGIDSETRALIEKLPEDIRVQTIKLLQDALPLIDTSVHGYLDRADEIMGRQIANATCAFDAMSKSFWDQIGEPTPISDLSEQWEDLKSDFNRSSSPHAYITQYADFLANAAVTVCRTKVEPMAAATIARLQNDVRVRWLQWSRVEVSCTNAEDCLQQVTEATRKKIKEADPRDVKLVNAAELFGQVQYPSKPTFFESVSSFFGSFHQDGYESALIKLHRIQDALELAKLKREKWYAFQKVRIPLMMRLHEAQLGNRCYTINFSGKPQPFVEQPGCPNVRPDFKYVRKDSYSGAPRTQIQEFALYWDEAAKSYGVPEPTLSSDELSFGVRCAYQGPLGGFQPYPAQNAGPSAVWAGPGETCGDERGFGGSPLLIEFSMKLEGTLAPYFDLKFRCYSSGWGDSFESGATCRGVGDWISQIEIRLESRGLEGAGAK